MNYLQFISENMDYNIKKESVIYNLYNEVSNFSYGVLTNKDLETDQSKFSLQYMLNNYKTLNEKEIKKYKSGICFDHSFYISRKLNEMGIKNTLYFLNGYWKSCNLCLCHVFCIANLNGGYYYIETAAGDYNGVYKSRNHTDLLKRVVNMIKTNGEIIGKAMNLDVGKFSYDLLNIHNNIPNGHTTYFDCFKFFYKNGEFCKNQHCKAYLFAICDYYLKQSLKESLVPKVLMKSKKEVTLYHGSPDYYKVLKPTGINFGNRLEKPSWSIFCFTDFESAKNWAAFRALIIQNRRIQDKTGEKIAKHMFFDSINNIGCFSIDSLEDTKNRLIGNKKKFHSMYMNLKLL